MSNYKLLPMKPTAEMVEAAEDAYMPFGDMDLAIRMAVLTAPDVQVEPVAVLLIDEPERTERGLELGDWDIAPNATAIEAFARLAGPGAYQMYLAPQPAEQQPMTDAAKLVEALDCILSMDDKINIVDVMDPKAREMVEIARDALAACRKQQEGRPATDVAELVDALEDIAQWSERWTAPGHPVATVARKALAAHRKGGGGV